MKTLLFLMIIFNGLLVNNVHAQFRGKRKAPAPPKNLIKMDSLPPVFYANSEEECIENCKKIASLAKREFEYVTHSTNYHSLYIIYKGFVDETPYYLEFGCDIIVVGANPALEIEGTKRYAFRYVWGAFLDIFPIWKEYFKDDADMVEYSTKDIHVFQLYLDDKQTISRLRFGETRDEGYFHKQKMKFGAWMIHKDYGSPVSD